MLINNIELEDLDIYDADIMEKVEKSIKKAVDGIQTVEEEEEENYIIFRAICDLIFESFNSIWGEGTSLKIFGDRCNVKVCMVAFSELVDEVERQKQEGKEVFTSIANKYTPNRVQRRAKK